MEKSIFYIIIGIYAFSWIFQVFYHLFFMLKTATWKTPARTNGSKPLSVIICAKNEAQNLEQFIPYVCTQDYPNYEVIVVNDGSSDETEMTLAQLKSKYSNLYYTSIHSSKQFYSGKKLALTIGIKAANNEYLIFTDADCKPTSDQWLKEISSQFSSEKQIIVGHGRFSKKKTLFNLFLRYETFWNAVQYMGFALRGQAFMAVGRNMAYTKSLFLEKDVFKPYLNMASGDDDLFMRACANKHNTTVQLNYNSQTESIPPNNMNEWINRKSRHLTTSPKYKFSIKLSLITEVLTRQIFWLLTLCSLFFPIFTPVTISLFVVRLVIMQVILGKAAKKMGENRLYLAALVFDLIIPIVIGYVWIINIFSAKKKKWK